MHTSRHQITREAKCIHKHSIWVNEAHWARMRWLISSASKIINPEETRWSCSNPRYSWVTYFILSNFCNFSQLVLSILSTHPFSLYQILSPYQSFVVLSNFCHLLAPCYPLTFYVIISPYKCTYCTHHKHNSLSCFTVRTLSAPIYLSYSPGVFGHRAILTMGRSDRGWEFPHRTNRYASEPSCRIQV